MTALRIEKLSRQHAVETFDGGDAALNRFLVRSALSSQQANAAQTYVGLANEALIGFYTLVVTEVGCDEAPARLTQGLARHPVAHEETHGRPKFPHPPRGADDVCRRPGGAHEETQDRPKFPHPPRGADEVFRRPGGALMLLVRLGVQVGWQGRGVGAGLLKDAMQRTVQAAAIAGIRALAVHAKDEPARAFYRRFDFIESPTDPLHLFLLVKDLRRYMTSG